MRVQFRGWLVGRNASEQLNARDSRFDVPAVKRKNNFGRRQRRPSCCMGCQSGFLGIEISCSCAGQIGR